MKNSLKSKFTLFYRTLLFFTISSMLISCSKTELAQPSDQGDSAEQVTESMAHLEGPYDTTDGCTFWEDPINYTTEITTVEYNIIEISNAFNLIAPNGEKATLHASVLDQGIIIPEQSYMGERYEISGNGTISEDGSISIDMEIIDAYSGDLVDSCTMNLVGQ